MRTVFKGATSQSFFIDILDSTSTTGGRKTGLAFNTAGLTACYIRNGSSAVAITLVTLAAPNSAWASGGFKEVDSSLAPGLYRIDVPDAAFVTGVDTVLIVLKGAAGMVQVSLLVQLTAVNMQSATSFMTGINGIAPPTNWNLMAINAAGRVDLGLWLGSAPDALSSGKLPADVKLWLTGAPDSLLTGKVQVDVELWRGSAPLATSSGNVNANVNNFASGSITSTAFASGAINAAAIASDAIGASELATDAVTEIAAGVNRFVDVTPVSGSLFDLANSAAAGATTMLARLGAWTGTGINTVLGAFKAVLSKIAVMPTDIGGTGNPVSDSVEALQEQLDVIQSYAQNIDGTESSIQLLVSNMVTNMLVAFKADVEWKTMLANAEGDWVLTPPVSFPGTGTLVLKNKAGDTTYVTFTLTFNADGVVTTRAAS